MQSTHELLPFSFWISRSWVQRQQQFSAIRVGVAHLAPGFRIDFPHFAHVRSTARGAVAGKVASRAGMQWKRKVNGAKIRLYSRSLTGDQKLDGSASYRSPGEALGRNSERGWMGGPLGVEGDHQWAAAGPSHRLALAGPELLLTHATSSPPPPVRLHQIRRSSGRDCHHCSISLHAKQPRLYLTSLGTNYSN